MRCVAVVGGAACTQVEAKAAELVGELLAKRGVALVCGGRGGVMAASCRGARAAGGLTIGLLPGSDAESGNPHLRLAFPTGMGQARNALVVMAGEAVIAIGGGYGTLSEIGLALKMGRRVVGLGTWQAINGHGQAATLIAAASPQEAVDLALGGREA